MPRVCGRSPRTPRGASITIAQAGEARKAVTRPRCTAIRRPNGWAADGDIRRATSCGGKHTSQEIKLDGEEFLIMREDEVLAVVETG
jgi:hypothetical protein